MDLTTAQISTKGPVRPHNEDNLCFWQPDSAEERRTLGAIMALADGVGGQGNGAVASGLAVEAVIKTFKAAKPAHAPSQILFQIFNAANLAVFDAAAGDPAKAHMATTLTAAVIRNNEVTVGHVGDCRLYLIHNGSPRRITTDHSYVGLQLKMGLISERDAMNSPLRSVLTRSVGQDPTIRVDYYTTTITERDRLVLCCDGIHGVVTEREIYDVASKAAPEEACKQLVDLAIRRGTDDNLSIQIVQVDQVEQVTYYRGLPAYHRTAAPAMSNELTIGQTLDDRFQIQDVINRSGMASIYRAMDLKNQHTVAVKIPHMQFESDPGFFARFKREEEIGLALQHPFILHVIDAGDAKSRPYIVMELLEGQTLAQVVGGVGVLPTADALTITSRICDALSYMHGHAVIHRDLKPQNIMICNDGSLRIMDFGIAKSAGARRITFTGFSPPLGTPDYMAPEQVKGKRGDERTDIYSLGAMLYEMVTGAAPFEGQNAYMIMNARLTGDPVAPRKIKPDISPQVEEIVLHAMERNPADRYPSAAAMKAELDNPDAVALTGRHERLRPPQPWKGRRAALSWAVGIPVAVLAAFGLWVLISRMMQH
jgi:serine/threonine-protein kinase